MVYSTFLPQDLTSTAYVLLFTLKLRLKNSKFYTMVILTANPFDIFLRVFLHRKKEFVLYNIPSEDITCTCVCVCVCGCGCVCMCVSVQGRVCIGGCVQVIVYKRQGKDHPATGRGGPRGSG